MAGPIPASRHVVPVTICAAAVGSLRLENPTTAQLLINQ